MVEILCKEMIDDLGVTMDISVYRLLTKIAEEAAEAKRTGSEAKIRERAQAIKAICELILDESLVTGTKEVIQPSQTVVTSPTPSLLPQKSRLKTDDGANGDSLFDF